jgi:hypothetical protein
MCYSMPPHFTGQFDWFIGLNASGFFTDLHHPLKLFL